jgi:tRNA nucleotidyltransferase (CCA-adding enzyme)
VPRECRDLALLAACYHREVHRALELNPSAILKILESVDAFRRRGRFEALLAACEADCRGRTGFRDAPYPQADRLRRALAAAGIDTGALATEGGGPQAIRHRVHQHRLAAIARALDSMAG